MALNGSIKTNNYDGRYYTLTWNGTQDLTKNQTKINYTLRCDGGAVGWYMERTLNVWLAGNNIVNKTDAVQRWAGVIKSGEITVTHDSVGNKTIDASISAAVYVANVNLTSKGSWALNKIPREATLLSAPNFTDEDSPTVTYTNPAGNSLEALDICITWTRTDDIKYRPVDKMGTSYTFYFTTEELNKLKGALAGKGSIDVKFGLRSTIAGKAYYSTITRTFSIANGKPTISAYAQETNSAYTNLTGSSNKIIKGHNNVRAWMNVTPKKGATIVKQTIVNGGIGTSGSQTSYTNTSSNVFEFNAEDSYGQLASKQVVLDMVDYFDPTCIAEVERPTADGRMTVRASGKFFNKSFGYSHNNITVKVRYKEEGGGYGNWQNMSTSPYGDDYNASITISGLNYRKAYSVQVRVEDRVTSFDTKPVTVRSIPLYYWNDKGFHFNIPVDAKSGFNINGAPLADSVLEISKEGAWDYIKMESGYVYAFSTVQQTASSGVITNYSLPSLIKNNVSFAPKIFCGARYTREYNHPKISTQTITVGTGYEAHFYIRNEKGAIVDGRATFDILAIGRWKQ